MVEKYEGVIAKLKNEGKKECINRILENHSFEEVANLLKMNQTELENILK